MRLEQEVGAESKLESPALVIPETVDENILKNPEAMVKIPAGEFLMGSDVGDEDELPDHLVFIQSFYDDTIDLKLAARRIVWGKLFL